MLSSLSQHPLPGRCQHTPIVCVCVCLPVVSCQDSGSSEGQFIAKNILLCALTVCIVSLCLCACAPVSKVINYRRITTVTLDIFMMTHTSLSTARPSNLDLPHIFLKSWLLPRKFPWEPHGRTMTLHLWFSITEYFHFPLWWVSFYCSHVGRRRGIRVSKPTSLALFTPLVQDIVNAGDSSVKW